VRYRVQNFSSSTSNTDVDVKIALIKDASAGVPPVAVAWDVQSFQGLGMREVRTGSFALNLDRANTDYTRVIEARPAGGFSSGTVDDFNRNDKKVFKFRSYEFH